MSIERIDFDPDTGRILYSCHYFFAIHGMHAKEAVD